MSLPHLGEAPLPPPQEDEAGNLLQFDMRILPEGEIAADSPAVTPAIGLKRHSQQLVASNAAAASKAAEKGKAAKAAAPGLLEDFRALDYVNPFTLNAQLKGWLEAGKAEVALKRLWHKAKPRGAYGPKVAGRLQRCLLGERPPITLQRWPHHLLKEIARIICYKNGGKSSPPHAYVRPCTVCACTLACCAHTCFRVLHSLYN